MSLISCNVYFGGRPGSSIRSIRGRFRTVTTTALATCEESRNACRIWSNSVSTRFAADGARRHTATTVVGGPVWCLNLIWAEEVHRTARIDQEGDCGAQG